MNREILFKAKQIDNSEWVEGNLIYTEDAYPDYKYLIIPTVKSEIWSNMKFDEVGFNSWHRVDGNTICQYTGLTDKGGNRIYENDILQFGKQNVVVEWSERHASWCLNHKGWMLSRYFGEALEASDTEVVGNVFDNPELLEV